MQLINCKKCYSAKYQLNKSMKLAKLYIYQSPKKLAIRCSENNHYEQFFNLWTNLKNFFEWKKPIAFIEFKKVDDA